MARHSSTVPTTEELRALYENERLTVVQIGERFGWGPRKARTELLAAGATLRRPGAKKPPSKARVVPSPPIDIEWVRARYCGDGWSLRDLAGEVGRSRTYLRDVLEQAGIDVRQNVRAIDVEDLVRKYEVGAVAQGARR